jgi:inhibitor of KinA sporulation pathway (predicted exonuclease)
MNTFVNIIDLEATCWDGETPPGMRNEIIEIGICTINLETLERNEKRSIVIKPMHSSISEFCTELTGWTQAEVDAGISFADACKILERDYHSHTRTWLSWGEYDRKQLERESAAKGVRNPVGKNHINAKVAFGRARNHGKKIGMDGALRLLGWELEGRHHNGADDAWNIARIVAEMLHRTWDETTSRFPEQQRAVQRSFLKPNTEVIPSWIHSIPSP